MLLSSVLRTRAEELFTMHVKLFVGNLPWSVGDTELGDIFASHGELQSARVINDRDTGRSRGFGFVEIETNDLNALIQATDGYEIDGRNLRVNQAEDKPRTSGGRGGFGGNGGNGGRRDRY
jgi:RNA recognition motif-containing protein